LDYAYYYRGLSSELSQKGLFSNLLPIDLNQRDPGAAREAFNDFSTLINNFPDSKYVSDARLRMVYLRNRLAALEIHVARYYLRRGSYIAAANRGRYVVENFQTTPSIPDGLAVMVEAYQQLGMHELSEQSFNVLALNYPDYPALGKDGSFNIKRTKIGAKPSFLHSATFGLFGRSGSK
jgi:outer membrane protein assembly factor BamD